MDVERAAALELAVPEVCKVLRRHLAEPRADGDDKIAVLHGLGERGIDA